MRLTWLKPFTLVKRINAPATPVPFSPALEKFWMPDEEDLIKVVTEMM